MSTNYTLKKIGRKLQEESSDIVSISLPERIRSLVQQLSIADTGNDRRGRDCTGTDKR